MMKRTKVPKAKSTGEETLALHFRVEQLQPAREFLFASPRKWRFDFCFPDRMLAIEVDGFGHNRQHNFEKDLAKLNCAAMLGWAVLRFTTAQVKSGEAIAVILEALGLEPKEG